MLAWRPRFSKKGRPKNVSPTRRSKLCPRAMCRKSKRAVVDRRLPRRGRRGCTWGRRRRLRRVVIGVETDSTDFEARRRFGGAGNRGGGGRAWPPAHRLRGLPQIRFMQGSPNRPPGIMLRMNPPDPVGLRRPSAASAYLARPPPSSGLRRRLCRPLRRPPPTSPPTFADLRWPSPTSPTPDLGRPPPARREGGMRGMHGEQDERGKRIAGRSYMGGGSPGGGWGGGGAGIEEDMGQETGRDRKRRWKGRGA